MRQILVGQFISALIAGTGVFSSLLAAEDLNFPIFLCFLNYVLLSLFVFRRGVVSRLCPSCYSSPVVTGGRGKRSVFEMLTRSVDDDDDGGDNNVVDDEEGTDALPPAHVAEQRVATVDRCARLSKLLCCRYVLAALVDVYANFLIILAYQYTTITSIMLLDCFTIPVAMLLSRLFLKCRYTRRHLLGVCLCLGGLVLIVISDAVNGDRHAGPNPLLGDILCLTGAALYGASNVLQEFLVKFSDRDDFMGWMGCCGAAISLVQLLSTDLPKLRRATYTTTGYLYTGGFVTCLFLMYTNTSAFLQNADSTLFNLRYGSPPPRCGPWMTRRFIHVPCPMQLGRTLHFPQFVDQRRLRGAVFLLAVRPLCLRLVLWRVLLGRGGAAGVPLVDPARARGGAVARPLPRRAGCAGTSGRGRRGDRGRCVG